VSVKKSFVSALASLSMLIGLGITALPAQAAATSPVVSGTPAVGSTLTVAQGKWDSTPAPTEQWFRNGLAIRGATTTSYTLTPSDYLQEITVVVKGKRAKKDAVEFAPLLPMIAAGPDTPAANGTTVAQLIPGVTQGRCALIPNGTVQCSLVSRSTIGVYGATAIAGLTNAVEIAGSGYYNCALILDGTVTCWGPGWAGGPKGNFNPSGKALKIAGLTGVRAISIGSTVCALLKDGSEKCFGNDEHSQLGSIKPEIYRAETNFPFTKTAQLIPGVSNAIQISSGLTNNCALTASGQTECWGDNNGGQLGYKRTNTPARMPVVIKGLSKVLQVKSNEAETCVVLVAGGITCWGVGFNGDGNTAKHNETLVGNPAVVQMEYAADSKCALMSDATEQCWGNDVDGWLSGLGWDSVNNPDDTYNWGSVPPFTLDWSEGVLQISSPIGCVVLLSGSAYCRGSNGATSYLTRRSQTAADLFGLANPVAAPRVSINGISDGGSTLTGSVSGLPENATSVSYNWAWDLNVVQSTDVIAGDSSSAAQSLAIGPDGLCVGSVIHFQVVVRTPGYRAIVANTKVVVPQGPVPISSTPTMTSSTGTFASGALLTAVPGVWTDYTTFKYVWKRDGVAISKATNATYKLVAADSGHAISVTVTGAADYTCTGTPYIPVTKTSDSVSVTG